MLEQHSFRPQLEERFAPRYRKRAGSARHTPRQNYLLAALTLENYERLLPDQKPVPLALGSTVHRAGDRENYRYFPTAGIVARFYVTMNGASELTGREGVTEAAGKLQADGLIQYRRGHITVRDRAKLEKRVCECYSVVKREYDRLLPERSALS